MLGAASTYDFAAGSDPLANLAIINDNSSSGTGPAIVLGSIYSGSSTVANARIFAERQSTGATNAGATDLIFEVGQASGSALAERLRITSTGNVGIGTSAPGGKLEVNVGADAAWFTRTAGNIGVSAPTIGLLTSATSTQIRSFGDLQVFTAPVGDAVSERMRITSAGNVGIGTTTPIFLNTTGSASSRVLGIRNSGTSTTERAEIHIGNAATGNGTLVGGIVFGGGASTLASNQTAAIFSACEGSNATTGQGNLRFYTTASGGTFTERLRITSAGDVGINETAPDYKLDVNGTFGFTPGDSVTPADNGDVVFELTNNTTLTVKAKGSDGVARSGTIVLV
jgi:hypothetical protein